MRTLELPPFILTNIEPSLILNNPNQAVTLAILRFICFFLFQENTYPNHKGAEK